MQETTLKQEITSDMQTTYKLNNATYMYNIIDQYNNYTTKYIVPRILQ